MSSTTRYFIILLLCLSWVNLNAQIEEMNTDGIRKPSQKRLLALDLSYNYGMPSDNFLYSGNLNNGSGAHLNAQIYFKKYFYAGFGGGFSRFSTQDDYLLGTYDSSLKIDGFLYLGFDYEVFSKVNLGLDTGIGVSSLRNRQNNVQNNRRFNDSGYFVFIAAPITIKLDRIIHLLIRPRYDFMRLGIVAPQAIQGDLNTAVFLNINIGFRFVIY